MTRATASSSSAWASAACTMPPAFAANPRFELAGIAAGIRSGSTLPPRSLAAVKSEHRRAKLVEEVRPDVFCFCTPPNVRLPLIELGIESGAKLIAFEKPVAMTSAEGHRDQAARSTPPASRRSSATSTDTASTIRRCTRSSRAARSGRSHTVYGTATGWAAHMLSHLVDYTSWFNDYEPAEWVMGQAAGRGKLTDIHASPDYVAGVVHFRNGVRGDLRLRRRRA